MKTIIIVQARMASTRLPGKIMKPVLAKPLLEYQIERLRRVKSADDIVIATTTNDTDNTIIDLCKRVQLSSFRGPEDDVLERYHMAAQAYQGDVIVRITSDCPIIDPQVIDEIIMFYLNHYLDYDYVSNTLARTYPRGMDVEIFSSKVLEQAACEANKPYEREHVTPFIYLNRQRYRLFNITYLRNYSYHRWTVDTAEDFQLIKKIIEFFYPQKPEFGLEDILQVLERYPEWKQINAHIHQKRLGE